MNLARRLTAEAVGTALLLATVVGSGIMGERLAGGNVAIALLANTVATGAALVTLILTFGSISGAHFNPAVTLADASQGGLAWREVPAYIIAQIMGAFVGVALADLMFELPVFFASQRVRHVSHRVHALSPELRRVSQEVPSVSHQVHGPSPAAYWSWSTRRGTSSLAAGVWTPSLMIETPAWSHPAIVATASSTIFCKVS